METLLALAGILLAVLLGAISPGPSFIFVARTAVAASRRSGLAAAAGMGLGAVVYATLALLGLKAVFASIPWLYTLVKLGGGAYLIYIAVQMWRGAKEPIALEAEEGQAVDSTSRRSFALAVATQLSNPKTAVFYASIFAALLPANPGLILSAVLLVAVLLIEVAWYTVVALLLSSSAPRALYLRAKTAIDRTTGTVMGLLGLKLISAADVPV